MWIQQYKSVRKKKYDLKKDKESKVKKKIPTQASLLERHEKIFEHLPTSTFAMVSVVR